MMDLESFLTRILKLQHQMNCHDIFFFRFSKKDREILMEKLSRYFIFIIKAHYHYDVFIILILIKEMAALSSTTACAAITSHTTSSTNVNSTCPSMSTESHSSSLADKIHGLTEKIQALGHHRNDSELSARNRTGFFVLLFKIYFIYKLKLFSLIYI